MKKLIAICVILALISTMLLQGSLIAVAAGSPAIILDTDSKTPDYSKGNSFTVNIKIINSSDLFSLQFKLAYDPKKLQLVDGKVNFNKDFSTFGGEQINEKDGFVLCPMISTLYKGKVVESITIATLSFKVLDKGKTEIELQNLKALNTKVEDILPKGSDNFKFSINAIEASPTPTPSPILTPTPEPSPVITPANSPQPSVLPMRKTFSDIGNSWAKNEIEELASLGIINGTSATTYSPKKAIIRADFIKLLISTLGLAASIDSNFDDVKPGDYFYEAVGTAKKLGITTGIGKNKFNPRAYITREDMMVLVERTLRLQGKIKASGSQAALNKFTDRKLISPYAVNSVAALVENGIIKGSGNVIMPKGNFTREEAAAVMFRIYSTGG